VQTCLLAGLAMAMAAAAWRTVTANPAEPPRAEAEAQEAKKLSAAALQTARNIGKAYYEQGKYPESIEHFQKVIASGQALATDYLNLGLALMQANRLDEALGALTTAKQMDPKLVAADYNLGILYKRELRYPDAEASLQRVIEADPQEPAAWFNLGTVFFAQRKLEEALNAHQQVVKMGFGRGQNFYVASLFHTFTTLVRLKRVEEAQKFLKIHETMRDAVPGISLQNPALEGGKYGAVLVPSTPPVTVARRPQEKVSFTDITANLGLQLTAAPAAADAPVEVPSAEYSLEVAQQKFLPLFGPTLALGDINQDGRPDLYVVNPTGKNRLLQNDGGGTFTDVTGKYDVAGPGGTLHATLVDHNNSGHPSLFLAGLGGIRVYRNTGEGSFVEETEKAGLKGAEGHLYSRVVLFDADNDGFVDLVAVGYADLGAAPGKPSFKFPDDFTGLQTRFYRNNGDGTFKDLTSSSGFEVVKGRGRTAIFADFDDDGYADVLILREKAGPVLLLGRGEGKFINRTTQAGAELAKSGALDAHAADFNHDGAFDLVLWSREGYQVLLNGGGARFRAVANLPAAKPPAGLFSLRGVVADVDGDTYDDLLVAEEGGAWKLVRNQRGRFSEGTLALPAAAKAPLASLAPTWLVSPGKLNLVGLTRTAQLAAFEKDGPASRWLEVKMSGFKSNTMGIGSVVELKAGNFYKKVTVTGDRVRLFTGDLAKLDVVRVTWPNAVIQNWVNVATNSPIEVRESERLASSCPFIYVWDGERFVYLTDLLGVAPLGHLMPDGGYIRPNPEEFVRLPEWMRPRDGRFVFQLTNELREVDYFDHVRLLAVDHPESEEVYANEIFSGTPAPPTLHVVRQRQTPVAARDHRGRNVLPLIREANGKFVASFRRLPIPGLAEKHALELDLGALDPAAPVVLYLRGWVYWTDSNNHRALVSNPSYQLITPYVQVRDEVGEWVTVVPDMGLPSGTNRTMRLDLTGKFLSASREVRIVTNMCVYWDEVFFTTNEGPAPEPRELPLLAAELNYRGFSTPVIDPEGVKPEYFEYTEVLAEAPWNPMFGNYTRYGDVSGLLRGADDRMVVTATGDQLTVEFDTRPLAPLRPGWKRTYFLYAHGWAKDGEPNTAFSRTVEPLPFREMSGYPYSDAERFPDSPEHIEYLREYQTRPRYKLIPPLAPPLR
jgi:Tfp pilus assembly protein PilF